MIKIGKRIIDKDSKPLIVAEIGINHFGSLKLAKKIVDCAKKTGAEAVKVQIHIPNEEMSDEDETDPVWYDWLPLKKVKKKNET